MESECEKRKQDRECRLKVMKVNRKWEKARIERKFGIRTKNSIKGKRTARNVFKYEVNLWKLGKEWKTENG